MRFLRYLLSAAILASLSSSMIAQNEGCKEVEVPVGIINGNGEAFHGLSTADFTGHSGKTALTLKNMTYDDGPRRVVLIVDTSRKLSAETRKAEQALVETLLDAKRPEDSIALITARGPEHVVKFGEQRPAYVQALPGEDEGRHGKEAGVLDAVMKGIELFGDPKAGDAVIVIAADLEGNHEINARRIAKVLEQHQVRMFGLALGPVSTKNVALSAQTNSAWGFATATPGTGDMVYNTGDEDFYPLTRDSGGLVLAVMNGDYQHTYSIKDPKFVGRVKQDARVVYNMVAGYYRVEIANWRGGEWSFEPTADVRKAASNMFLLYPHTLAGCSQDSHVAQK